MKNITLLRRIESKVISLMVKIIQIFFKGKDIRENRVCYISYKHSKLVGDMKLISEEIRRNKASYEIEYIDEKFLLQEFSNSIYSKIRYLGQIFLQIYYVSTSKIIIIDGNNIVISSMKKRKESTIIQIWHATGAIKKFGNDYKRLYPIKNYDYVITSSMKSQKIMSSAFNLSEERILPIGIAKTDKLFNNQLMERYKREMQIRFPQIVGKKVVLYAPTFRGDGVFERAYIDIDLNKIQKKLGKQWIVMYKHHPINNKESFSCIYNSNIINVNNQNLYKLFSIAEILISDYSSIIYDFTILEKPIILFTPDLESYEKERGFYISYEKDMPGTIAVTEEEVVEAIHENNFDREKIKEFKNEFFYYLDGKSSGRIANFILGKMKDTITVEVQEGVAIGKN